MTATQTKTEIGAIPLTTEDARHVAESPDGSFADDIRGLANYIGNGVRPMAQAAALWPNEVIETIPNYASTAPTGRLFVAKTLRNYCSNKATAMECRERGWIATAIQYEDICERLYNELPGWARW